MVLRRPDETTESKMSPGATDDQGARRRTPAVPPRGTPAPVLSGDRRGVAAMIGGRSIQGPNRSPHLVATPAITLKVRRRHRGSSRTSRREPGLGRGGLALPVTQRQGDPPQRL